MSTDQSEGRPRQLVARTRRRVRAFTAAAVLVAGMSSVALVQVAAAEDHGSIASTPTITTAQPTTSSGSLTKTSRTTSSTASTKASSTTSAKTTSTATRPTTTAAAPTATTSPASTTSGAS
jgi:hypothetical protein